MSSTDGKKQLKHYKKNINSIGKQHWGEYTTLFVTRVHVSQNGRFMGLNHEHVGNDDIEG